MLLDALKERLSRIDPKDLFRYCIAYLAVCCLLVIGIMVRHVFMLQEMQDKTKQLNKSRATVQSVLTQYQSVQQQKQKVEIALQQNKNFNIQKYYQDLSAKHNIAGQSSFKFNRQKLPNGYFEESLQISITQINTKMLCELLLDIEQESLVYTISVDITKMSSAQTINVTLSIATLQAQG